MQDFLYTAGDYVVLAYPNSIDNIEKIQNYTENVESRGAGTIFKKEFRYSFDNETFSEYFELSPANLSALAWEKDSNTWFQFRYSLLSGGPSMVKGVSLQYTTYPVDQFAGYVAPNIQNESKVYAYPITYRAGAKWDPYKMNRAVRLYKDLNLMVNSTFGHEVHYYRVQPLGRSRDVYLMEYSLYEHDEKQCIKVVVPNNAFPDNKLSMGPFGVDFEMPFEIQIDKDYFQAVYGDGVGPQKRDVIYFPRTGRIYEISSSYLFRDFMNEPLYFKATLIKWLPKSNVEASPDIIALESLAPSVEAFFGEEQEDEGVDIANPVQFQQTTEISDPVRFYVDRDLTITDTPIMNYYFKVAEYQYSLAPSVNEEVAIIGLTSSYTSVLESGKTYYARFARNSAQPSDDYFLSMKKLKYLGLNYEGKAIFQFYRGESMAETLYKKWQIFGPASDFYLFASEYVSSNTTETPLFSCKTSGFAKTYQDQVVKYKALGNFTQGEDRAYSAWFKVNKNERFSSRVSSVSVDDSAFTMQISYEIPHDFFVGDHVSVRRISGGNFNFVGEIVQIVSDTQITVSFSFEMISYLNTVFPNWKTYQDFRVQLTVPRTFIDNRKDGKGMKIDLLEKRYFRVHANSKIYYFFLPNTSAELSETKWYNVCVSVSNLFSQLTLNVWEIQWNEATNTPATSDLRLLYGKNVNNLPKEDRSSPYNYFLTPSDTDITNIRVWSQKIETDKQPFVLNQNIVKDASKAIVIDNAIPQSRLPYISYTH